MKDLSVDATLQPSTYIVAVAKATALDQLAEICLCRIRFSLAGPCCSTPVRESMAQADLLALPQVSSGARAQLVCTA